MGRAGLGWHGKTAVATRPEWLDVCNLALGLQTFGELSNGGEFMGDAHTLVALEASLIVKSNCGSDGQGMPWLARQSNSCPSAKLF